MEKLSSASRRTVLQLTGGTLGAVTATGGVAGTGTRTSDDRSESVELNVGYGSETGRRAIRDAAAEVIREFAFPALTVRVPDAAVEGLRARSDVSYVEENGAMHAVAQSIPWGVDAVDAPAAPCTGASADVAIVDTGIDSDHPDLQANLGTGAAVVTCTGASCRQPWDDDNGHGTHVAGVVGAVDNSQGVVGVAPDVTLHAVKVLDDTGQGTYSDVAAGIQHVATRGWDVANLSLAGNHSSLVESAISYAYCSGVLPVAAAGNRGPCTGCVAFPASHADCVAVTATDGSGSVPRFASGGPSVEFIAPGVDVRSTWVGGGYRRLSGTSVACPHVSGTAALAMAQGATNVQARNRMRNSAVSLGLPPTQEGHGQVEAPPMC